MEPFEAFFESLLMSFGDSFRYDEDDDVDENDVVLDDGFYVLQDAVGRRFRIREPHRVDHVDL